ncbi:MAG: M48 family metallopeptidase [Deltaproteobacteria bacterium]|nr:M48 family metallopeptidase [Deltaproteobacteria bacterium]
MTLTFETLITHNKRASLGLMAAMMLVLALLCGAILNVFYGVSGEFDWGVFSYGAVIGCLAGSGAAVVSYFFGSRIIALINDARPIERHEDTVLFNVVEEMAIAAGLPMPKIYVIPDESPNAFATGRDPKNAIIGITTGLRKKLDRDELQAVIAHEMAHIKNYDIRLMMLVAVFAGIIVLVSDFFLRSFINDLPFRGRRRGYTRSSSKKGSGLAIIALVVALLLAWLAPLLAKLLQLAVSREREYLADSTAVQLCRNPLALAGALKKIALDPEKLEYDNRATEHLFIVNPDPKRRLSNADKDSIWSTHPPLIKRIAKLNKLAGAYDNRPRPDGQS